MARRPAGFTRLETTPLREGWRFAASAPSAITDPAALAGRSHDWVPATVPCTVASALRAAGLWSLDGPARQFDAEDWWFECRFPAAPATASEEAWLCFDGLATVADVWLNDTPILESTGMFTAHACRVDALLGASNRLVIRFRALDALLTERRARPRWRTPMVSHQQLRWYRTTLLGRTPGWSTPAAPVGPWREIRLERRSGVCIEVTRLETDGDGRLEAAVEATTIAGGHGASAATLVLSREGRSERVPMAGMAEGRFELRTTLPDVERWWPHTHGTPALYDVALELTCGTEVRLMSLGSVGFRSIEVDTAEGDFRVRVNGVAVFCRGACWTPLDVARLDGEPGDVDAALDQVVACSMNMLRVGGTMVYESDRFLDGCDARGILLWQDLMFANMDYPESDAGFVAQVEAELRHQLSRLRGRPALAVVCGNSEGAQQAAMWGAPRELWDPKLFHVRIPALVRSLLPGVAYWPSSAHGGAFPHQPCVGTTSYYGVGAYLRDPSDARRSSVRFATECLAFANAPDPLTIGRIPGGGASLRVHHPEWKARTPRDRGAGWDFEDVRDHYVALLFGVDPVAIRYADHDRYLELGRVAVGELMAASFGEWRRTHSVTRGALVWFLRDLWRGAGWGIVDSDGHPKVPWHYLRRALAPVAAAITDEGTNGLAIHLVNDRARPFSGRLEVACYRGNGTRTGSGARDITVPANGGITWNAIELFDGFRDLSDAYRFGPPAQDATFAVVRDLDDGEVSRAVHFRRPMLVGDPADIGLHAGFQRTPDGARKLRVGTRGLALAVHIEVAGFQPMDNAFHLAPGEVREIPLKAMGPVDGSRHVGNPPPAAEVRALNSDRVVRIEVPGIERA